MSSILDPQAVTPAPITGAPANGAPRSPSRPDDGQLLVLDEVSWHDYEMIGKALRDRPALRLTYDQGRLEIMTTSFWHELSKTRLGKLIETISEELARAYVSGGNMTFKREALKRGFEPDNCYWIEHERQMRGRTDYDQRRDPPPDLTLEIEVSRRAVNRMAIFAQFRVPEVWRYDGKAIHVHVLTPNDDYTEASASPTFPSIPIGELTQFLHADQDQSILDWLQAVRAWVRKHRPQS
jgi:Uma2 family endonuclease